MYFLHQALYCSLGASLLDDDRIRFDDFIKRTAGLPLVEDTIEKPAQPYQLPTAKQTLYEYTFVKEKMVWMAWEWLVPTYTHNRIADIYDILVPTEDTLKIEWILGRLNAVNFCFE